MLSTQSLLWSCLFIKFLCQTLFNPSWLIHMSLQSLFQSKAQVPCLCNPWWISWFIRVQTCVWMDSGGAGSVNYHSTHIGVIEIPPSDCCQSCKCSAHICTGIKHSNAIKIKKLAGPYYMTAQSSCQLLVHGVFRILGSPNSEARHLPTVIF